MNFKQFYIFLIYIIFIFTGNIFVHSGQTNINPVRTNQQSSAASIHQQRTTQQRSSTPTAQQNTQPQTRENIQQNPQQSTGQESQQQATSSSSDISKKKKKEAVLNPDFFAIGMSLGGYHQNAFTGSPYLDNDVLFFGYKLIAYLQYLFSDIIFDFNFGYSNFKTNSLY